ncbi:MAG: DEAD/DEAH box helicase family protein [Opitutaceae bacterium]|jgi:type III restriction enzyme|nr:DEAD/DEAH box helicase family protein [Opitutaceae bacterium]
MARARTTSISPEAELPIQAPVEEPIINSPFEEPKQFWAYDKTGHANKMDGRRGAAYFWTTQRVTTGQESLEGIASDYGSEPLALVNALRKDVKRWRESGYENATKTTRRLFEHWRDDARKERGARRFFFCQLEAVETVVYLNEILASGRRTRWKPEVSAEDFAALIAGDKPPLAAGMSDAFFPMLRDGDLTRLGCKMATGSGKTVVMAMLLAWAFCNRGAVPGDTRFPSAALVCCPNLTVKERLQVLRTDGDPEKSYFAQFDIVPPALRGHLQAGRVLVTNWHAFAPESEHAEGGKNYAVINKGAEGPDAFARRVLRELYGRGELLVLNDEAHHAYRPAPPEKAVRALKKKKGAEAAFGEASEEDNAEATVWVEGLDKLKASVGVRCCVDLSATPFYLAGSGHVEGSPFPWLVSDFGLVDAIESGITKIPRIPVADTTGRPDPQFFKLWEDIRRRLKALGDANFDRGKPKPEPAWREAQAAFNTLASQWKQRFEQHGAARPGQNFIPPVLIVVCDNTDLAQVVFEHISGERVEEIEGTDDDGKTTTRKERRFSAAGVPFRELANSPEKTVTLRIDSKLLAEADAGGAGGGRLKEAERLRELIASVGKPGTAGEHVRCVVSVQMLTEGWDASNVTQILGLRAFGSQLLCEQVVGRGLRRISYDVEQNAAGEERLRPEYVDVYGIPFSLIPFKGRETKAAPPDDTPVTRISALPERAAFELRFPNVDGYVLELRQHKIRCDVAKVEALEIKPTTVPTQVFVQPQVGIKEGALMSGAFETVRQTREEFYRQQHFQTVLFEITRRLVSRLTDSQGGAEAKLKNHARHQLFPQVLAIVENYAERRVRWNGCDRRELALETYTQKLVGLLADAIEPDESGGEPPLLPVINRFHPSGTTADVSFTTKRPCHPTLKSHIDAVVLDTDTWERSVAFQLEASDAVMFYARNDHLGLEVPYEFLGVSHKFLPDFVARLASGVNLLLEVKGYEGEEEKAKHQAAKRWVSAVNNWGRLGRWAFHVCKNPDTLRTEVEYLNGQG